MTKELEFSGVTKDHCRVRSEVMDWVAGAPLRYAPSHPIHLLSLKAELVKNRIFVTDPVVRWQT